MDTLEPATETPEIVLILAPPRSFTSVTCAMLGQHPELYGVPELRLFAAATLGEWTDLCRQASYPMATGTLRAVAQLLFGEQTETIFKWRANGSDGARMVDRRLIRLLGELVHPRILVDKSPSTVYSTRDLFRASPHVSATRFIHLLRHPRGHAKSVLKLMKFIEARRRAPLPSHNWLVRLSSFPLDGQDRQTQDPQRAWYVLNSIFAGFLS